MRRRKPALGDANVEMLALAARLIQGTLLHDEVLRGDTNDSADPGHVLRDVWKPPIILHLHIPRFGIADVASRDNLLALQRFVVY